MLIAETVWEKVAHFYARHIIKYFGHTAVYYLLNCFQFHKIEKVFFGCLRMFYWHELLFCEKSIMLQQYKVCAHMQIWFIGYNLAKIHFSFLEFQRQRQALSFKARTHRYESNKAWKIWVNIKFMFAWNHNTRSKKIEKRKDFDFYSTFWFG